MAVINLGQAISKCWAEMGPLGWIGSAFAVAANAAATAIIASETMPNFALGTPPRGFTVPQGYANDSYRIGVSSGEKVNVTPADRNGGEGGGNRAVVHVHINAPGTPVEMVRDAVVEGLRQTGLTVDRYLVDHSRKFSLSSI
jgi:hypothetical protein